MTAQVPFYYRWLIAFAKPLYRRLVKKKSAHLPTLHRELNERFGQGYLPAPQADKGVIWCHAVSLGELNTAYPLLKLLLNQGFGLWITSTTQTGFGRAVALFGNNPLVNHSFVPVDDGKIVEKFLAHVEPKLAMFVETELWATMLYCLKSHQIPAVMVNARLTERSFLGYQRFGRISRGMMENLSLIIAQDADSLARFGQLGASADKLTLAPSLKWASSHALSSDNQALLKTAQTWHIDRPIWVAGSTHDDEESQLLAVHEQILSKYPNALLIIVPRHPERFETVADLCRRWTMHRRSHNQIISADTQIYLADSMGELLVWYALADVVFVGGSLIDKGGHNPIEPASLAKFIIMGHFLKNCQVLTDELSAVGALKVVENSSQITPLLLQAFANPAQTQAQGEKGRALVQEYQTADQIQYQALMSVL